MSSFYAHGKLLLTGEYLVLDGAKALAIPTRRGQELAVQHHRHGTQLDWKAKDQAGKLWLKLEFSSLSGLSTSPPASPEAKRLLDILLAAQSQKPDLWPRHLSGRELTTILEFDRQWGLGSSSTLIALLAQYFEIDAHRLLADTFGGSGYDLACAFADGPILYRLENGLPRVDKLAWQPEWLAHTHFVYLGQKQNSREGISRYRKRVISPADIEAINDLTDRMIHCQNLSEAQIIMHEHERQVSRIIGLQPVQDRLFPDFSGAIKSLGAWGGDFVWVASEMSRSSVSSYFSEQGYETLFSYESLVYHHGQD